MNVTTALSQISAINTKAEAIFNQLGSLFTELLSRDTRTTFYQLQSTVSTLAGSVASLKESAGLASFGEKYNHVFEKLNEKITDLHSLDKMIAEIKEDSEQMELIALNAMVISVKSGEKGLAFSRITENLQRLSNDMFQYSDKLSGEEASLLEDINSLKAIFSGILDAQKSIVSKDTECSLEMSHLVSNVSPSMDSLEREAGSIYAPIEKTRDSVQIRDTVSESLRKIAECLREIDRHDAPQTGTDGELDFVCLRIAACEKIYNIISGLSRSVGTVCADFAGNWSEVIEILDKSDGSRMDFESRFLNSHAFGNDNIERQLNSIAEKFHAIIGGFSKYHLVQKDLQGTCQGITAKAKSIYSVFENLRPVMSRLHHVRILQQIEVSKNDAIKSVQDSVTDMDNLISSANKSLDQMEYVLESFIHDTTAMLSNFIVSIRRDNEAMERIKIDMEVRLGDLTNGQRALADAVQDFAVFPGGFQSKCVQVQQNLQEFMRLNSEIGMLAAQIDDEKLRLIERRSSLLGERGMTGWEIKNQRYIDSLRVIQTY